MLVAYVDAPGDFRPEYRPGGPDGSPSWYVSLAQQSRHLVAAPLAVAFWSAASDARSPAAGDTVTVRLARTRGFRGGWQPGWARAFTLVRPAPGDTARAPRWLPGVRDACRALD